ncbi:NUDIX hydrolase [Dichotomicrobium thermohalophilum]|uniref:NrtR DNA-binding winged helix domain-containing protein n=1 Tax=Dichotomicrobium thermohalophilum TaxID=933063 RepID=A0A397QB70_9HYPH|nr:NAD regulator [Dichotomicrobium thermohalophilum]RIA55354.1 hypothetical protein BXY53_0416 [Dichotomicrobium thermohalophilum]
MVRAPTVNKPADPAPDTRAPTEALEAPSVEIGLSAAIICVHKGEPQILVVRNDEEDGLDALPSGPFNPLTHRTLEIGLRSWVAEQTGLQLGYVEQLYTFGDRGRHARYGDTGPHVMSIGYLALTRAQTLTCGGGAVWRPWYDYFPWEDRRGETPAIMSALAPLLEDWAGRAPTPGEPARPLRRSDRLNICFGLGDGGWDEEKALERYELLYEAGLVTEALQDGREAALGWDNPVRPGRPMRYDHRRILATAMSRLRGKIKYRPVIFELLPERFTLSTFQCTVEAILGSRLHKQNFRRLVANAGLVEPAGGVEPATGGRPAQLYRFRREVLLERPAPGVRVNPARGGN